MTENRLNRHPKKPLEGKTSHKIDHDKLNHNTLNN